MNDDDAFRERLAALSEEQLSDLYDTSASEWTGAGFTKAEFLRLMALKRASDEALRQPLMVYETAVAMSEHQAVRDAKRAYEEILGDLCRSGPAAPPGRTMGEVERLGREASRAYDAAILAAGDERVVEAKRAYEDAIRARRAAGHKAGPRMWVYRAPGQLRGDA